MDWNFREELPPKREWVLLYLPTGVTKSFFRVGKYLPAENHPEYGTFTPQRWKLTGGRKLDFHQVEEWTFISKPEDF